MRTNWTAEDSNTIEFWLEHCKWDSRQLSDTYGMAPRTWRERMRLAREQYSHLPWRDDYRTGKTERPESDVNLDELRRLLKNSTMSVGNLADYFSVPPKGIRTALDMLRADHIMVEVQDDMASICTDLRAGQEVRSIDMSKYKSVEIPMGFIADTHLGSKYERLDVLESLYDRFAEYGVQDVYHGGNWIEGEARFNRQDIVAHGIGGQVAYFCRNYPARPGIKTHIISGDDHEGWYVQREGVNIGKLMESTAKDEFKRHDLIDLGYIERDIELTQAGGSAVLRVAHLGGGSTYAHSYTAQKYVESLQGGEKPKIVLAGHYHKFSYNYPREVHVIQPGCTEDQTPFMRKRKIQAMVGGCVAWVTQNELGIVTSFKLEWLPYYDKKFYAYKW
jgi:hypothetical protein